MLNNRQYDVQFQDGTIETLLIANVIAKNILSQVDQEGHCQCLFEEIIDHQTNEDAVSEENAFINTPQGSKRNRKTTKGWELCVTRKDGDSSWISLKDFNQSYPIELALYSKSQNISHLPTFVWWVPYVL